MDRNIDRSKKFQKMLDYVARSNIHTWFDMGLFMDKIKDTRQINHQFFNGKVDPIHVFRQGIAFIHFDYGIDGASMEISKYAENLESILSTEKKQAKIHLIAGTIKKEADSIFRKNWIKYELKDARGFSEWDGYDLYFNKKLYRGSEEYNRLAKLVWKKAKKLINSLGKYFVENNVQLLIPVNVCSNPGNVALALAIVIVSELLQIPVLNSNHDFYWEDGSPPWKRKGKENSGLRDHFFLNADIGEVFSLIEMLYPWESPLWFNATINELQRETLTQNFGFNPMSTGIMPTAIDTEIFRSVDESKKFDILKRIEVLFSGGNKGLYTTNAMKYHHFPSDWESSAEPLYLGFRDKIKCELTHDHLIFLQPTRILKRKRIQKNFQLIDYLISDNSFKELMIQNPNLAITLFVTGPVIQAHISYLEYLVKQYSQLLTKLGPQFQERVFLALGFGGNTNPFIRKRKLPPLEIYELYAASNLALLPSKQEGRGLPILESAASGAPIVSSRYHPTKVFSELIGENLEDSLRLRVLEFPEHKQKNWETIKKLTLLFRDPHYNQMDIRHNREVIKKRYTYKILQCALKKYLRRLWDNLTHCPKLNKAVGEAFNVHLKKTRYDDDFKKITLSNNRKYLPGICELEFMVYLKSLIDPNAFRIEEKELRGRIFVYANRLIKLHNTDENNEQVIDFFRQIDLLFNYYEGEDVLITDHSFSYRHRNKRHYPYRKLTEPELRGIINILLVKTISFSRIPPLTEFFTQHIFQSFSASIHSLVGSRRLRIDDRYRLINKLDSKKPFAWFPGASFTTEALVFVKMTLYRRLGLKRYSDLSEKKLKTFRPEDIGSISLFVKDDQSGFPISRPMAMDWLNHHAFKEIRLFYKLGFLKIIKTDVVSSGMHLGQLGSEGKKELQKIKNQDGFVVCLGEQNMLTQDMIDMDSFRLGICNNELFASYMGLELEEAYILWAPAGLRPSLAFPTPVQTPLDFYNHLHGKEYYDCVKNHGEEKIHKILREDADSYGTPIKDVLASITNNPDCQKKTWEKLINHRQLTGLHSDESPWSGAMAKLKWGQNQKENLPFNFHIAVSDKNGESILSLIKKYENKNKGKVKFSWNGGYILNPELVGKLGLPENYIGSPLGLIVRNGKILSLPLFNKPALVFYKDGGIEIKESNLRKGFSLSSTKDNKIYFTPEQRNREISGKPSFYDLFYDKSIKVNGDRIVFRFAGNTIIEELELKSGEITEIFPVGITISMPKEHKPRDWKVGSKFRFLIPGWENIWQAVESGPMLVRAGKQSIEMKEGGWKEKASIATQAARVDYTHMRGPKIGVGLTREKELVVIAVNGRIRESVGATHIELATILMSHGADEAMGFDPGGSVTLVVDGKQLNISPYNKNYLLHPFSASPQPRFVGNAVMGVVDN